ncbi:ATP-binding protein [Streptomyces sp. NBC_01615]|uniref:ATP-binding protein n=1 Tax=Streptomyces sp. NBC_01615 TaxID=2975898 RepID=UPI00386C3F3C
MTDAEWAVVRTLLPVPGWMRRRGGQPEAYCHRAILDAIRYLVDNGIKWRAMPADFPPWDRVYAFFRRWRDHALVKEFHDRLRARVRTALGRDTELTAGVIDSQSVKADAVGSDSRGFDGGKLVNELVEAADEKQLTKTIARYGRVDLLCIDELGYMELDRRGAELLFQVLTEREEKNSVAIASNESFGGWTKTFTDPRLCAAIVDRLTFNGTIIETGTDSYRLASTRAPAEEPAKAVRPWRAPTRWSPRHKGAPPDGQPVPGAGQNCPGWPKASA